MLTKDVVALPAAASDSTGRIGAWEAMNSLARERASRVVEDVVGTASPDLAMLSVALRELRNLASAGAPAGA